MRKRHRLGEIPSPGTKERAGGVDCGMTTEHATFAAGCFWGVEADFLQVPGVIDVASGYTSGHKVQPTYREVCSGTTGHAEAVLVEFDPSQVSYEKLVDVFFSIHDPTQLNRQGPDYGSQYRSGIYFHSLEQEATARAAVERHQPNWKRPIVTEIVPASEFWKAEEYHQRYFEKNGVSHCRLPS